MRSEPLELPLMQYCVFNEADGDRHWLFQVYRAFQSEEKDHNLDHDWN